MQLKLQSYSLQQQQQRRQQQGQQHVQFPSYMETIDLNDVLEFLYCPPAALLTSSVFNTSLCSSFN